ncbi:hypothetical protein [Tychonema sp. LEGE 07203]|uniref:hypothetical protein n=1 Tax=Tychonema sp. LEGE 07203 TaxID=1828671 RepID=UPI00187E06D9|nr:hypothetical protein [Tychonema sp. LEGE 07203]MBE9093452.1 hypothetical protein [Tychonema sp. LEGE 07203]
MHLPISGGNSSNSNPAKSNFVSPSSADESINCINNNTIDFFRVAIVLLKQRLKDDRQ